MTATGTVSVLVDDDTPIAVAGTSTGTSTRTRCPGGIDGGHGRHWPGDDAVATGSVTALFQSGADVPLSYAFNTAAGALPSGADVGRRCGDLHDRRRT